MLFRSKRYTRLWFLFKYGINKTLFFHSVFKGVCGAKIVDTWDYQWWYHQLRKNGLSIIPRYNLVENIGFGRDATHTSIHINPDLIVPVVEMAFPLIHPDEVSVFDLFEKSIVNKFYSLKYSWVQKIKAIKKLIL